MSENVILPTVGDGGKSFQRNEISRAIVIRDNGTEAREIFFRVEEISVLLLKGV